MGGICQVSVACQSVISPFCHSEHISSNSSGSGGPRTDTHCCCISACLPSQSIRLWYCRYMCNISHLPSPRWRWIYYIRSRCGISFCKDTSCPLTGRSYPYQRSEYASRVESAEIPPGHYPGGVCNGASVFMYVPLSRPSHASQVHRSWVIMGHNGHIYCNGDYCPISESMLVWYMPLCW